ncbi:MAG: hypothetical protein ACLUUO_11145 [Sellimonas intestinalis]|jgi:hypothetical protein|nr:hypothetical protein [Sellimonas intestinalis]
MSNKELKVSAQQTEDAVCLWNAVCEITERGNNAEIKRKKDGSFTVYEVKKKIVAV